MDENEGDDYTIFDNNKKLRHELKKLNDNLNSLFNSKNPSNESLITYKYYVREYIYNY